MGGVAILHKRFLTPHNVILTKKTPLLRYSNP